VKYLSILLLAGCAILLLAGCAVTTTTLEEELAVCEGNCEEIEAKLQKRYDIEYRDAENAHKWEVCKAVYKRAGAPTISYHRHDKRFRHSPMEIGDDLFKNGCHRILKDVWD